MFEEYLRDKRVCLVGPGSQTEIMKLGKEIDSYDIVARVGHYMDLVPDEIGSRTDIICENFWCWSQNYPHALAKRQELYDLWVNQGVKWFNHVWPNNMGLDYLKDLNKGRISLRTQPDPVIMQIRRTIDSPTKGICSVMDMLTMPIKELFLVGFTASRGFGYRKDYLDNRFGMPAGKAVYIDPNESAKDVCKWTCDIRHNDHRPAQEFDFLKSLSGKVRFDEWAERVLSCG